MNDTDAAEAIVPKSADSSLQADLTRARRALAAGRYRQVIVACERARTRATTSQLFKYHPELDNLCDRAELCEQTEQRVRQLLQQLQPAAAAGPDDQAVKALDEALASLAAAGIEDLASETRALRDTLWTCKQLPDQISDVRARFEAQDFREAQHLIEIVHQQHSEHPDVILWRNRVNRQWNYLQSHLTDAAQKLAENQPETAIGVLEQLRQDWPNNPDGLNLWLRVHLEQGLTRFEAGRLAFQIEAFDVAGTHFAAAEEVLRLAGGPLADPARAETSALLQTATFAALTQSNCLEQHWETAHQALQSAREKLAEASAVHGHGFEDISAVLERLGQQVEGTIASVAQARFLLAEGQELLARGAPDQAENRFQEGLALVDLNDAALRQTLLLGLQQAEVSQREVLALVAQAEKAKGDVKRVELLGTAYARWPGAPGMPGRFVDAILLAADRAVRANDEARASDWCAQVLGLTHAETTPAQREQATQLLSRIQARHAVSEALAEAEGVQAQLDGLTMPEAGDYRSLVAVMERAQAVAQEYPEALPEINQRLHMAQDRLDRLSRAEPQLAQAGHLRSSGDWDGAVRELGAALEILGDLPAPELRQRLQTWQEIASTLRPAEQGAEEALAQAHALYAATAGDTEAPHDPLRAFAGRWPDIDRLLNSAKTALDSAPVDADPLPRTWTALQQRSAALGVYCRILHEASDAVAAGHATEALDQLAAAAAAYPDEHVLVHAYEYLLQDSTGWEIAQARHLLVEARAHADDGEWALAQEKLSAASQLKLAAKDVAGELHALERQLALWSQIIGLHGESLAQLAAEQPAQALIALAELLHKAADTASGLPAEVRAHVNGLLGFAGAQLYEAPLQQRGTQLCEALASAAVEHRLVQDYLLGSARTWFNLAVQQAFQDYITAQLALSDFERAYLAARQAIARNPQNTQLLQQANAASQGIQIQLRNAAQRRLDQAQRLQEQGAFDVALVILDGGDGQTDVEAALLRRTETDFPEIIRADETLSGLHRAEEALRHAIASLQTLSNRLMQTIEEARGIYLGGRLEEAGRKLAEVRLLEHPERAQLAWGESQSLQNAIETDLRNAAVVQVQAAVNQATVALGLARAAPDARQIVENLASVQATVEQLRGPDGEALHRRVDGTLTQAQTLLAELESVIYARQLAVEAEAQNDLQSQMAILERIALVARGQELEEVKAEIERQRPLAERQRQMHDAWSAALIALDKHDFPQALDDLAVARQLGRPDGEVEPYRAAAQAGLALVEARMLLQGDAEAARGRLRQIMALTENCPPANELRAETLNHLAHIEGAAQRRAAEGAARHEEAVRRQQAEQALRKRISALLRNAHSAFRLNRLAEARQVLSEIFVVEPENSEAQALWERLDRAEQANALMQRVKELREGADYDVALELVRRALELHPDMLEGQELPAQLTAEREAGIALARALDLAQTKRFVDARVELQHARDCNPRHPRLTAILDEVQQLEKHHWDTLIRAAEAALARQAYRVALHAYAELAAHLDPAEAQARLGPLLAGTVDQWADGVAQQANTLLQNQSATSEELAKTLNDLQEVLNVQPAPIGDRIRQLNGLIRRVGEARLRRRLAEGYDILQKADTASAAAIGLELEQSTAQGDWPSLDFLVVKFSEDVRRLQESHRVSQIPDKSGAASSTPERPDLADAACEEARAALSILDLATAEHAIEAGRGAVAADPRWSELTERLRQAREAIPVCQTAMAAGWAHLQARDFGQAQADFASAAVIAGFEEPSLWQHYAGDLQEGVALALNLEEEDYAILKLADAEANLRLRPSEPLSPLWGDRLLAERRRAVYHAWLLRENIVAMVAEKRRKDELKVRNDAAGASQILRRLIQRQESFPDLVKQIIEPPDAFDASAAVSGQRSTGLAPIAG